MSGNCYIAEGIGTFGLVFAGCGAIIVDANSGGMLGHVGISMVFGLIVMTMIYSLGNVSGAHINPAVTIGFVVARRLSPRRALAYIGSQLAGATAAAGVLRLLFPASATLGATLPAGPLYQAFSLEVLLSFLLMLVILNVATGRMEKGIMAGVAVGGMVALEALIGGPVSGASMNPARSFGPALIGGDLGVLWLYVTAPIVGMLLACPACRWIQGSGCCAPRDPVTDD